MEAKMIRRRPILVLGAEAVLYESLRDARESMAPEGIKCAPLNSGAIIDTNSRVYFPDMWKDQS